MVAGFTTTYAIIAYDHQSCEFEPQGNVHYPICSVLFHSIINVFSESMTNFFHEYL
jgi:hypothetical protein